MLLIVLFYSCIIYKYLGIYTIYLLLFIYEYISSIKLMLLLLYPTKYYTLINVKEINPRNPHIIELLIKISDIKSFVRIYNLLKRLKPTKYSILFILISQLIFLPLRLVLTIYTIFNFKIFNRHKLNCCYYFLIQFNKNKKIEVLGGLILLNCYTYNKLIQHLLPKNQINSEKSLELINKLIKFTDDYVISFSEEKDVDHPLQNYYLLAYDLSINIIINFKWFLWAYNFFIYKKFLFKW